MIIINLIDFVKYFLPSIFVAIISGWFNSRINKNTQEFKKEINESNKILTKEINESNEKLNEKLSKDRIKADLVASARTKWIEDVRNSNIEYISALVDYCFNNSCEEKQKEFIKKNVRMRLYFSRNIYDNLSNDINKKDYKDFIDFKDKISELYHDGGKTKLYNRHELNNAFYKFLMNTNSNLGKSPYINMMFYFDLNEILLKAPNKSEMDDIINRSIEVISNYLKIEWDRVKKNE